MIRLASIASARAIPTRWRWPPLNSRRNFLQLAAAGLGLAGLTACTRQPIEKIVPYARQPEELVPGRPLLFATAMPLAGRAVPLLAESHEGRPTKVEGNPEPTRQAAAPPRGSRRPRCSASTIPNRSQAPVYLGRAATWREFDRQLGVVMGAQAGSGGAGLRLLTGPVTSPTEAAAIQGLLASYPQAKWHRWDPLHEDRALAGSLAAFGRALDVRYDLAKADLRMFSFAGPDDFNATLEPEADYLKLLTHGIVPIGYESDGNLWVIESPCTAASMVYLLDLSAWDGGKPAEDRGLVFAASRFALLLSTMAISELSYQDSPAGITSILWHEDAEVPGKSA